MGWLYIARFNMNGSADTTFDYDGKVAIYVMGSYDYRVNSIALQKDGKLIIGGYQRNYEPLYNYVFTVARLKNNMATGVPENSGDKPGIVAYPNPFSDLLLVQQTRNNGIISLFDITGKEIIALVNEQKDKGDYKLTFDVSNINSGIYFVKIISTGNNFGVLKLVKK